MDFEMTLCNSIRNSIHNLSILISQMSVQFMLCHLHTAATPLSLVTFS